MHCGYRWDIVRVGPIQQLITAPWYNKQLLLTLSLFYISLCLVSPLLISLIICNSNKENIFIRMETNSILGNMKREFPPSCVLPKSNCLCISLESFLCPVQSPNFEKIKSLLLYVCVLKSFNSRAVAIPFL